MGKKYYCHQCDVEASNSTQHKRTESHKACVLMWAQANKELTKNVEKNEEGKLFCKDCNSFLTNKTAHCRTDYHQENVAARIDNRPTVCMTNEKGEKKITRMWVIAPTGPPIVTKGSVSGTLRPKKKPRFTQKMYDEIMRGVEENRKAAPGGSAGPSAAPPLATANVNAAMAARRTATPVTAPLAVANGNAPAAANADGKV